MFGLLFSFEGWTSSDLVMKAKWTHLYSSRTQKLSTSAATIAGRAPVKIARCQVGRPVLRRTGFFVWRACHISRVKIPRGVVIDEPKSDLQVSYREVWERGSNSEIVA